MVERLDVDLPFGDATIKPMPTGEIRRRVRLNTGVVFSETTAATWRPSFDEPPVQEDHWHEKVSEVYVHRSGLVLFVWIDLEGGVHNKLFTEAGETLTFAPGIPHRVLPGPGAVFTTTQLNMPMAGGEFLNDRQLVISAEDLARIDSEYATALKVMLSRLLD